jgi:hypothetical protein
MVHDRARNDDALLLAARKLLGPVADAMGQRDALERGSSSLAPFRRAHAGIS